jgi:carboxymethylenebutenolidase
MCYSDSAHPPLPPIMGGAGEQGDLVLTATDGNRLLAYAARAAQPGPAGMVILPDVRGLHSFYKELAERFAQAGVNAVAIDYYGRTEGLGDRSAAFDYKPHLDKATASGIDADVAAGIAYLRGTKGGAVRSVFTVGFCFGGANSWQQSATQRGLAGAVGFYGRPSRVRHLIPQMKAPLLILDAGADAATPQAEFHDFDQELGQAGVPRRMVVFEGAPHSFFDRTFAQHQDASARAWREMLDFIGSPKGVHTG